MIGRLLRMLWSKEADDASAELRRNLGEAVDATREVRRASLDRISAAHGVAPTYASSRVMEAVDQVVDRYREARHRDP